ncbi:MAG: CPBP family intramembrane metalloprotease [Anaerolineales bacterium]|nr:CPBP family intramembrane metalloprotease [Anaerolineales bacterium]
MLTFIKRFPLVTFFAISIGSFYLGAALLGIVPEALYPLFIYGTALGALLVVAVTEGRAGVRAWASRIVRWRVGLLWYAVALGLPIVLKFAAYGLNLALGAPAPPAEAWGAWAEVPFEFIFVFLTLALGEELGFRGYALPKLLERHSPLAASLILGVMRVIWHVPLVVLAGDSPWVFAIVIAGDILFTWIFLHTRGSVLIAMLLHSSLNASGALFGGLFTGAYAAQNYLLLVALFVAAAVALLLIAGPGLARRRAAPAASVVAAPAVAAK